MGHGQVPTPVFASSSSMFALLAQPFPASQDSPVFAPPPPLAVLHPCHLCTVPSPSQRAATTTTLRSMPIHLKATLAGPRASQHFSPMSSSPLPFAALRRRPLHSPPLAISAPRRHSSPLR
ncbi:hypothetical protein M422DRAFT_257543 [Sphaerobolus stellatus SS14]|uniref:Uncharacterized protein n=1 Tax=Sphaerobolus stellatus (strain SS14) TaxID=990650 RepID=A0A0C9VE79_SPHS4|nr:hypothetical protein M422DRAFT_257543 [Sphaerobolus stellatus SS14]